MKARVDKNSCIGCGLCTSICPDVFEMDDDGAAKALDIELLGNDLEDAECAKEQCPMRCIEIE